MAPRRSRRSASSAYKKGDYVEYQYKGSTVAGRLVRKSSRPAPASDRPLWVVHPSDRRRKNEEIPERALGRVIGAEEAASNRGPKLRKTNVRQASGGSDGSPERAPPPQEQQQQRAPKQRKGGRGPFGDENSKTGDSGASPSPRKRKGGDDGDRATKSRKAVTFSREPSNNAAASSRKKSGSHRRRNRARAGSARIGTRSTCGPGEEMILLPDLPRRTAPFRAREKRIREDENVTVVKMFTGTLYLYRGDRPRAEFVRTR